MNPDRTTHAPSNTFTLSGDELIALQAQTAQALGLPGVHFHDALSDGSAAPELAVIPAGAFEYGAAPEEAAPDQDRPRRAALIEHSFAIGVNPVTTEEFEAYAHATGWKPREELLWLSGRMPVIDVRQTDALDYCAWLSRETGQRYRLPTEVEWEYACRAGVATTYPHGDSIGPDSAVYNLEKDLSHPKTPRSMASRLARCGAKEVGGLRPNRWGLFDMPGNVWEFTASPWTPDHASLPEHPQPGIPQAVVTKGGSWFDGPECCRPASRCRRLENELDINLGFRVVREL
ncbi:MAG: formylglycine-generating enzyme family protein [Thiobacillus sp.]